MNFVFVFSLTNCSMLDCTCQQIFPFEVLPKKEDEIKKADKTRASRVKVLLSLSLPRSFSITYSVILHLSRLVACAMQTITITITFADTSSSHTIKTKYLCATPALAIVQFSWAAHSSVGLSGSLASGFWPLSHARSLLLLEANLRWSVRESGDKHVHSPHAGKVSRLLLKADSRLRKQHVVWLFYDSTLRVCVWVRVTKYVCGRVLTIL